MASGESPVSEGQAASGGGKSNRFRNNVTLAFALVAGTAASAFLFLPGRPAPSKGSGSAAVATSGALAPTGPINEERVRNISLLADEVALYEQSYNPYYSRLMTLEYTLGIINRDLPESVVTPYVDAIKKNYNAELGEEESEKAALDRELVVRKGLRKVEDTVGVPIPGAANGTESHRYRKFIKGHDVVEDVLIAAGSLPDRWSRGLPFAEDVQARYLVAREEVEVLRAARKIEELRNQGWVIQEVVADKAGFEQLKMDDSARHQAHPEWGTPLLDRVATIALEWKRGDESQETIIPVTVGNLNVMEREIIEALPLKNYPLREANEAEAQRIEKAWEEYLKPLEGMPNFGPPKPLFSPNKAASHAR